MSLFSQSLHITRDTEIQMVRLSVATSEGRVDEITLSERDFKYVAKALWEKSAFYDGCTSAKAKFKTETGFFSLSVQTGMHTRTVYRLTESEVMPVIGQYMAETGGE
jgi:hypothetical protein